MIDVHCHILPFVDDGPKSTEEALEAIDFAYQHGTRAIVATPHFFHPEGFNQNNDSVQQFSLIQKTVATKYPDFKLLSGAEVYMGEHYLRDLERIKDNPTLYTLNQSRYLLVEFSRQITLEGVLAIIHEIKVMGLIAVVAHIEVYPNLAAHVAKVKAAGAVIQVTASSFSKTGSDGYFSFCRELLLEGLIDVIASDGHGMRRRRPYLDKAYDQVKGLTNRATADALFSGNPYAIISDKRLKNEATSPTKSMLFGKRTQATAVVFGLTVALVIFSTSVLLGLGETDGVFSIMKHLDTDETSQSGEIDAQQATAAQIETSVDSTLSGTDTSLAEVSTEDQGEKVATETEAVAVAPKSERAAEGDLSQSAIEAEYYTQLKYLERLYTEEAARIAEEIEITMRVISDKEKRRQIIDAYIDEVGILEAKVDKQVYDLLYDMQNALEANNYGVEAVKVNRLAYLDAKAKTKSKYIDQLK